MLTDVTPQNVVRFAVATEDLGEQFYRQMAAKFDGEELKSLFHRLANDEADHKKRFVKLLSSAEAEDREGEPEVERKELLQAMSMNDFFSQSRGPFSNLEEVETVKDALERAFGFEKAAVSFYQAVQDVLGPNQTIAELVEEEKKHVVAIMKVMLSDAEFRSMQDDWP